MLPSFEDKVWIGVSAGSMVMSPPIGQAFVSWKDAMTEGVSEGNRRRFG